MLARNPCVSSPAVRIPFSWHPPIEETLSSGRNVHALLCATPRKKPILLSCKRKSVPFAACAERFCFSSSDVSSREWMICPSNGLDSNHIWKTQSVGAHVSRRYARFYPNVQSSMKRMRKIARCIEFQRVIASIFKPISRFSH